jgi:hypothetical protein
MSMIAILFQLTDCPLFVMFKAGLRQCLVEWLDKPQTFVGGKL